MKRPVRLGNVQVWQPLPHSPTIEWREFPLRIRGKGWARLLHLFWETRRWALWGLMYLPGPLLTIPPSPPILFQLSDWCPSFLLPPNHGNSRYSRVTLIPSTLLLVEAWGLSLRCSGTMHLIQNTELTHCFHGPPMETPCVSDLFLFTW